MPRVLSKPLVAITLVLITTPFVYAQQRPLVFGSSSFPPFFGEQMPQGGPLIQILTEAFQAEGRSVDIKWLPWTRVVSSAKEGKTDGIAFAWHTKERESYLVYGADLFPNEVGLFAAKNRETDLKSTADLPGKVVGVVRGYAVPDKVAESGATFFEGNSDLNLLKMLAVNRIDYVYTDKHVGYHLMLKDDPDTAAKVEWALTVAKLPNYLAISKQIQQENPQSILEQYQRGLRKLKQSGRYSEILHSYRSNGTQLFFSDHP